MFEKIEDEHLKSIEGTVQVQVKNTGAILIREQSVVDLTIKNLFR